MMQEAKKPFMIGTLGLRLKHRSGMYIRTTMQPTPPMMRLLKYSGRLKRMR